MESIQFNLIYFASLITILVVVRIVVKRWTWAKITELDKREIVTNLVINWITLSLIILVLLIENVVFGSHNSILRLSDIESPRLIEAINAQSTNILINSRTILWISLSISLCIVSSIVQIRRHLDGGN